MAIADTNILRMIEIDTVAIANLEIVQKIDSIDDSLVTAHEMYRPICSFLDGDIADGEIADIRQRQYMRARIESLISQRLQLIGVFQLCPHEGNAVAMNGAFSCYTDVLGIFGPEPQHAFAAILTECAQVVDVLIRIGFQGGCRLQVEFHVTLQLDRACHKCMITRKQHSSTTLSRAFVDDTLNDLSVVCLTITLGSKSSHIVDDLANR